VIMVDSKRTCGTTLNDNCWDTIVGFLTFPILIALLPVCHSMNLYVTQRIRLFEKMTLIIQRSYRGYSVRLRMIIFSMCNTFDPVFDDYAWDDEMCAPHWETDRVQSWWRGHMLRRKIENARRTIRGAFLPNGAYDLESTGVVTTMNSYIKNRLDTMHPNSKSLFRHIVFLDTGFFPCSDLCPTYKKVQLVYAWCK